MGLQDALRKAAGLLIERTPEEQATTGGAASSAEDEVFPLEKGPVDVDALLAEKGLGPRANAAKSTTIPGTPSPNEARTVEQIVRDTDGPNLDEIKANAPASPPGGVAEPLAIYKSVKLPDAPFTAEQMLDMLASLPKELPLETRRQTVNVTFGALGKSMGATPETVVADASRKIAALASYEKFMKQRTEEIAAKGEAEIQKLQEQAEAKRKEIFEARAQLQATSQMCARETDRLDDVLEFFSLDIAPSKYAGDGAGAEDTARPAPGQPVSK